MFNNKKQNKTKKNSDNNLIFLSIFFGKACLENHPKTPKKMIIGSRFLNKY